MDTLPAVRESNVRKTFRRRLERLMDVKFETELYETEFLKRI